MEFVHDFESLEVRMSECWKLILERPVARQIREIVTSGDRRLYALWLSQVAHLTRHTSAHQALVGTRIDEISFAYQKFCFQHAAEEVAHEMMAINDLRKLGFQFRTVKDLPPPLPATRKLTAYLYAVAERAHPATRLGFSYWAENCYAFVHAMASETQKSLGLSDQHMSFFVSHAQIDEKHAQDVEQIIKAVCVVPEDWRAVGDGMMDSLFLAEEIFKEIFETAMSGAHPGFEEFFRSLEVSAS